MSEGTSISVVDGGGPPPPSHDQRDATRSAQRASMAEELAKELAGLDGPAEPAAEEKPETPEEPEAKPEPKKAKAKEEAKEEPEDDDEAATDEEPEEPEKESKAGKPDKDLQRRLSSIQREEKRAKAALAEERKVIAEERRAVDREREEARAELGRVRKALESFKTDPVALAREAGVPEELFEELARAYYAASPKGKADPRLREHVARSSRDMKRDDELADTRRELAELRQTIQQQTLAQQAAAFIEGAAKAASDETPLVSAMLEKSPQKARARLAAVADRLVEETGEVPDYEDVVTELEKIRREELEELGIDVDSAIKAPKQKPVQPAAKTKPAKALDKDLRAPGVQPRSQPMSRDERRRAELDALVADMAAGRLDA